MESLSGLNAFVTAARLGSYVAAAERLGISASAVGKSVASAMAEAGRAGAVVGRVVASAMGDTARIVGVAMGDVGRIAKRTFVDLTPQWVKTGVGRMASLWGAGVGRVSSAWSTATTSIGVSALSVSDRVRSSLGTAYTWVGGKAIDAVVVCRRRGPRPQPVSG